MSAGACAGDGANGAVASVGTGGGAGAVAVACAGGGANGAGARVNTCASAGEDAGVGAGAGSVGIWPVRPQAEALAELLGRRLSGHLFRPWEQPGSQRELFRQSFASHAKWVLVMATGIAARFIDGLLEDKHYDPAVVVIDEAARYAIALVGGHEGGANALAYRVANAVGATPVVTTASEATRSLVVGIGCRKGVSAKQIEAAVLHALALREAGGPGLLRAPEAGAEAEAEAEAGGLGGRASKPRGVIEGLGPANMPKPREGEGGFAALGEVRELVTVDLKAEEPGLVAFAEAAGIPLRVIGRQQIEARPWVTKESEWVRQSIGLEGVCEPCALIACPRGRLVVPKTAFDGVAVAVVEDDWRRAL